MKPLLNALLAGALLLGAPRPAPAHDLAAHRLTLVVHNERHLQAQWQLDWLDLLHDLLAPDGDPALLLLRLASEPAAALEGPMARVRTLLEQQAALRTEDGRALPLTRWQWPSAAQLHEALQQRAARQLLGERVHEPLLLPVRAEALAEQALHQLELDVPPALERVLVVSYAPQQRWVEAGRAQRVRFSP